ncbi:MAG: phosphatase PAP2 family protein [Candidatus Eremiobacteraeota bacterium]|nr:phosphatase PAP2 family protein [Candidatus Eremiobacteraeota bacterium]
MKLELLLGAALCFAAFAWLGWLTGRSAPTRLDVEASAMRGQLTVLAVTFTRLGRWYGVTFVAAFAATIGARTGKATAILALFVLQLFVQFAVNGLKIAYGRPRPDQWLHRLEVGSSYPSGHAATAIVFFGGLLLYSIRAIDDVPRAILPLVIAALAACVIGLPWARVALGAHYATDVIGGLLFGTGCLCTYVALAPRGLVPLSG